MKKTWLRWSVRVLIPFLVLVVAVWSVLSNRSPFAPFIANLFLGHEPRVSSLGSAVLSDDQELIQESQPSADDPAETAPSAEASDSPEPTESPAVSGTIVPEQTEEVKPLEETETAADPDEAGSEGPADDSTPASADTTEASSDDQARNADEGDGTPVCESPDTAGAAETCVSVPAPQPSPVVAAAASPVVDAVVVERLTNDPAEGSNAVTIRGTIRLSQDTPDITCPILVRVGIKPWPNGSGDSYEYVLAPGQRELTYSVATRPYSEGISLYKVMADIPPYWATQSAPEDFTQTIPFGYENYGAGAKYKEWAKSLVVRPTGVTGSFGPVDFVLSPFPNRTISGTISLPKGQVAPAGGVAGRVGVSAYGAFCWYGDEFLIPEGSNSVKYRQVLAVDLVGSKTVQASVNIPMFTAGKPQNRVAPYSSWVFHYSSSGPQVDERNADRIDFSGAQDITGIDFPLKVLSIP